MSVLPLLLGTLQTAATPRPPVPPVPPFRVGERFEYAAKFGLLTIGSGGIEVASIDTVRGQPAYHFRFTLAGGVPFYKINSSLDSWASVGTFHSLRFRR